MESHINNTLTMQRIYMTLLVHKHLEELFQLLNTRARFLFTALSICHLLEKQRHFIKCHHCIDHFSKL